MGMLFMETLEEIRTKLSRWGTINSICRECGNLFYEEDIDNPSVMAEWLFLGDGYLCARCNDFAHQADRLQAIERELEAMASEEYIFPPIPLDRFDDDFTPSQESENSHF